MKAPSSSKDITKSWLEYVLGQHLASTYPEKTVTVKNFNVDDGAGPSDGFNSELVVLQVETLLEEKGLSLKASVKEDNSSKAIMKEEGSSLKASMKVEQSSPEISVKEVGSSPETVKEKQSSPETSMKEEESSPTVQDTITFHLVAKFLSVDPMNREFNRSAKSNLKEYLMYTDLIKELNEFQAARAPDEPMISMPELIYGKCTDKEFVLLMENLQVKGYKINDKRKGLDFQHLKAAVDQLARIHAVSYAYNQTTDLGKKYPCISSTLAFLSFINPLATVLLEICCKYLKSLGNKNDVSERLGESKQNLLDKLITVMSEGDNKITCLNHGDYWNCNFMYKYKDSDLEQSQQHIEKLKVIDWGNSSLGNPVFDLHYIVNTSTTVEVRNAHLEEILQYYHSTFTRLTTKMGTPPANWTFEEFKINWEKTQIVGFILGSALTLGTLNTCNLMKKPEPSVLDKPLLLPVKLALGGMKQALAKLLVPMIYTPMGQRINKTLFRLMFKPILAELQSGKNEVMSKRILDLLVEADEKGLFTVDPTGKP